MAKKRVKKADIQRAEALLATLEPDTFDSLGRKL